MAESFKWLAAGSAALAFVLVGIVRMLAVRHGVLDHPTERSSHATVTPRGGGLGVILTVLALGVWSTTIRVDGAALLLLLGAAVVAAVGWLDDRRGLSVRTRLAVHVAMGALVGIVAATDEATLPIRILLFAWWSFWTVSSLNLVNFMDGINGLVASQVVIFALSLALFPASASPAASLAIVLAAACVGFLPWNFPRARIFLGDVGSGALGYLVPALALLAKREQGTDFVLAHLPLLPLYADATWTIVRRWRNGERITTPHRSHLYQRLANGGMGHTAVTILYAVVAIGGAIAAHAAGTSWRSTWTVVYAIAVVVIGLLLHRRVARPATAASS
jgi:UDP-N-acetylmuramyl pentapeptide phosphotransferase/UDP-N-acetylglucosamine-1-phosphate transferase